MDQVSRQHRVNEFLRGNRKDIGGADRTGAFRALVAGKEIVDRRQWALVGPLTAGERKRTRRKVPRHTPTTESVEYLLCRADEQTAGEFGVDRDDAYSTL